MIGEQLTEGQLEQRWAERDERYAVHRHRRSSTPLTEAEVSAIREWRVEEAGGVGSIRLTNRALGWEPPRRLPGVAL